MYFGLRGRGFRSRVFRHRGATESGGGFECAVGRCFLERGDEVRVRVLEKARLEAEAVGENDNVAVTLGMGLRCCCGRDGVSCDGGGGGGDGGLEA